MKEILDKLNEIIKENPDILKNNLIRYCKGCNTFKEKARFKRFLCNMCFNVYMANKSREFYSRNSEKVIKRVKKYNNDKIIKEFKEKEQNNDTKS